MALYSDPFQVIHDPIILQLDSICHGWFFQIPNLRAGRWSTRGKRCCRHRGDGLLLPSRPGPGADGGLEDFKLEEEENSCGWMSSWSVRGDWAIWRQHHLDLIIANEVLKWIVSGERTPSFKKAFLYLWTRFMVSMRGWYVSHRITFLCLLSHITNLLSLPSNFTFNCPNVLEWARKCYDFPFLGGAMVPPIFFTTQFKNTK